ncbi:MAG: AtpZ/AtpI family protein [Oscillospiraceae bacterium]|jgi:ATP synthase protein I|nr:AtpZ/AtpI family protein [Oscillospiraceae bacterium]
MPNNEKPQQNEFAKAFSYLLQIGVTIIACLAVGIFLGWLLDRYLGTAPWLMMTCTFLGIGAAFKSIFEFAKKVK